MTPAALPDLADADRAALLAHARSVIESRLGVPSPAVQPTAAFAVPAGAFVTVRVAGELRGCIGLLDAAEPLASVVGHCAASAAFGDPRFDPVRRSELGDLVLEISVLSPLTPVPDVSAIEVGRHGLVVEQGRSRGLLLPQVAVEHGWDRDTFLRHTCRKAGLPADAWQRGATLLYFEAVVFGEPAPVAR